MSANVASAAAKDRHSINNLRNVRSAFWDAIVIPKVTESQYQESVDYQFAKISETRFFKPGMFNRSSLTSNHRITDFAQLIGKQNDSLYNRMSAAKRKYFRAQILETHGATLTDEDKVAFVENDPGIPIKETKKGSKNDKNQLKMDTFLKNNGDATKPKKLVDKGEPEKKKKERKPKETKKVVVMDEIHSKHEYSLPPLKILLIPSHCMSGILQTHSFMYCFARELRLSRFPLHIYCQALKVSTETRLLKEIFVRFGNLCVRSIKGKKDVSERDYISDCVEIVRSWNASVVERIKEETQNPETSDEDGAGSGGGGGATSSFNRQGKCGLTANDVSQIVEDLKGKSSAESIGLEERVDLLRSLMQVALDTNEVVAAADKLSAVCKDLQAKIATGTLEMTKAHLAKIKLMEKGGASSDEPASKKLKLDKVAIDSCKRDFANRLTAFQFKNKEDIHKHRVSVLPVGQDRFRRIWWIFPGDNKRVWVQNIKGFSLCTSQEKYNKPSPVGRPAPEEGTDTVKPQCDRPLIDDEDEVVDYSPDAPEGFKYSDDPEFNGDSFDWGFYTLEDSLLKCFGDGPREAKLKQNLIECFKFVTAFQQKQDDERAMAENRRVTRNSIYNIVYPRKLMYYQNFYFEGNTAADPLQW